MIIYADVSQIIMNVIFSEPLFSKSVNAFFFNKEDALLDFPFSCQVILDDCKI